jgi:hypothetical protein
MTANIPEIKGGSGRIKLTLCRKRILKYEPETELVKPRKRLKRLERSVAVERLEPGYVFTGAPKASQCRDCGEEADDLESNQSFFRTRMCVLILLHIFIQQEVRFLF